MRTNHNDSGFTMIEFSLVVAISSILAVGLAAVVEIPLQMAQRGVESSSVSSADRVLAILDADVRFAMNVETPDSQTLVVTDQAGDTIKYAWDGVAKGGLTRTSPDGSAVVLKNIQALAFALGLSDLALAPNESLSTETIVQTAAFNQFQLKPSYSLAGAKELGTTVVSEVVTALRISDTQHVGFAFTATGLGGDVGLATSIRVRVRRNGTCKLAVQILEADATGLAPDKTRLVADAEIPSSNLPVAFTDLVIPVTPMINLVDGGQYFLCLKIPKGQAGSAADVEARTLSDPDAAAAQNGGLLYSTDSGKNFAPQATRLDASQSVFQVEVTSTAVEGVGGGGGGEGGGGATTIQVPTSVHLKLQLASTEGPQSLKTTFTVENNVALVHQSSQK